MKLIRNPWCSSPGYNCYGCSPDNPIGAHMRFYEDGDAIVSYWRPGPNHQSWKNTLHGGMQATLLDEVCGWVVFHKLQTAGVTARMELKYHKPVSTLLPFVKLRGTLTEMRRNIAYVKGEILAPVPDTENEYELLCECTCVYFTYPQEQAVEQMGYLPSITAPQPLTPEEVIATL